MQTKLWLILALMLSGTGLSGCAAAAVGAAGAVGADAVAEDQGGNLF